MNSTRTEHLPGISKADQPVRTWGVMCLSLALATSMVVLPATSANAEPAPARVHPVTQFDDSESDCSDGDSQRRWRCEFTDGKGYRPEGGGPTLYNRNQADGFGVIGEKVDEDGVVFTLVEKTVPSNCARTEESGTEYTCDYVRNVAHLRYWNKEKTLDIFQGTNRNSRFLNDASNVFSASGANTARASIVNERTITATTGFGLLVSFVSYPGNALFSAFSEEPDDDISRNGMCYYNQYEYVETGTVSYEYPSADNSITYEPIEPERGFVGTESDGWYGPEWDEECS